jgi:hypothetical protein
MDRHDWSSEIAPGFFPQEQPSAVGQWSGKTGMPCFAYQSASAFMFGLLIASPCHEPVYGRQRRGLEAPPGVVIIELDQWRITSGAIRLRILSKWKPNPPCTFFAVKRAVVNHHAGW